MKRSLRFGLPALATLLLAGGAARAEDKSFPSYEQAVREQAPKIIEKLHAAGYKNVGVLKFLARNENGSWRDNLGPINRTLADRLEIALLVALKPTDGLGIIFRASDVVAKSGNLRATHRTEEGRAEFFEFDPSQFKLPWNQKEAVQPDAFLTGEATLSADLRKMTVKVQAFGKTGADKLKLQTVGEFVAAVDPRTLTEAGISFVGARGPFDKPIDPGQYTTQLTKDAPKADDSAETWQKRAETLRQALKDLPITVEILYNGELVKIEPNPFRPPAERDNVLLRVREPLTTEAVSFRLTNTSKERFGVVIKVNGQSSIYMEEREPLECYKWILEPEKSTVVDGFLQRDKPKADKFLVRSEVESRAEEVNYGVNAGTFAVIIFREATSDADQILVKKEKERELPVAMISRGTEQLNSRIAASDLDSFRGELVKLTQKEEAAAGSRGIVVPGKEIDKLTKDVSFKANPIPAFSATIRYFDPKTK